MTREQGLHPEPTTPRPHLPGPGVPHRPALATATAGVSAAGAWSPAVLIEVPEVPYRVRPARRPSDAATARLRAHGSDRVTRGGTPRRRLRREVRAAGYVLGTALSLAAAAVLLHNTPSSAKGPVPMAVPGHAGVVAAVRPPAVSLSLEPSGPSHREAPECAAPVVLPGYVLPDDGAEDSPHAGG